jgi:hypothetical protein
MGGKTTTSYTGCGPQESSRSVGLLVAELTLGYGRYNELDNYGNHGVYKPTNKTGGAIL